MVSPILNLEGLHVASHEKSILYDIFLKILPGKVYAIMGPNGAGKSTLAAVLSGKPGYTITQGKAWFMQTNLLELNVHQRAAKGLFVAFQQPISLPGVSMMSFLKTALNQVRQANSLPVLTTVEIVNLVQEKVKMLEMSPSILKKSVNENFSGGEKKLNELLQMAVLNPKLAILDEIDSGLDLDTLSLLGKILTKISNNKTGLIMITHNPRVFEYVKPDVIYILQKGRIVESGNILLAKKLLKTGYKAF